MVLEWEILCFVEWTPIVVDRCMILELCTDQLEWLEGLGCGDTFRSQVLLTIEVVRYVDNQVSVWWGGFHIGFLQWLNQLVNSSRALPLEVPATIEWTPCLFSMWESSISTINLPAQWGHFSERYEAWCEQQEFRGIHRDNHMHLWNLFH